MNSTQEFNLYNNLEIENCKLSNDNILCVFLKLVGKFGDSYKIIYKKFAKEQNKKSECLYT